MFPKQNKCESHHRLDSELLPLEHQNDQKDKGRKSNYSKNYFFPKRYEQYVNKHKKNNRRKRLFIVLIKSKLTQIEFRLCWLRLGMIILIVYNYFIIYLYLGLALI